MARVIESLLVLGYDRVLLKEARWCLARSRRGATSGNSDLHAGAAASAIVAACSAVESFLSEHAAYYARHGIVPDATLERINSNESTYKRLNRLVKVFHSAGIDRTTAYQDLEALTRLRNCIVHRKAKYLETKDWPADIEPKHQACIPHLKGPGLDWTSRVLRKETAKWAVDTARTILADVERYVLRAPTDLSELVSVLAGAGVGLGAGAS